MGYKEAKKELVTLAIMAVILYFGVNKGLSMVFGVETPLSIVTSGSMKPNLTVGDLLVIEHVEPEDLKVGDIIVFTTPYSRYPVVHRIVEIEVEPGGLYKFKTKGDANPRPDIGYRTPEDIYGRVKYRIPLLGYVFWPFQTLKGKIILIGVLGILIAVDIYKAGKEEHKVEEEPDDRQEESKTIVESCSAGENF